MNERPVDPDRAARRAEASERFGSWMTRSASSPASRAFFAAVHQMDGVRFDMLDPVQLAAAIEAAALGPGLRALDLGCSIGTVTEHVALVTGARIHGVDFARAAIALAQERAAAGVSYAVGDLDEIEPEEGAFDAILAFDTLYFASDLPRLIRACLRGLVPGGRLVAFWTALLAPEQPEELLSPEGSRLAQALREAGATFTVQDFSAEDAAFWERSHEAVERTKALFEAEGSLDLWESRRAETERVRASITAGRSRRYLYAAVVPGSTEARARST